MTRPVVVVAAHADDEVLGCGGTIARLAREGRSVHVLLLADGESSRSRERGEPIDPGRVVQRAAAANAACRTLGCASVEVLDLPDNRLDQLDLLDVVRRIEDFLKRHHPSTVFTHHSGDVNIDHRVTHEAVIAACRPQPGSPVEELIFFEVPSSTEWRPPTSGEPFNPNLFVDISETLDIKFEALRFYGDELREFPHSRSLVAIQSLAQWRGATAGLEAAEAFVIGRKIVRKPGA